MLFRTIRPCRSTVWSHISHVVLDTATWGSSVAFHLETSPLVQAYARNDHLYMTIPYDYAGTSHGFLPDFLVRLTNGTMLMIEIKGCELSGPAKPSSHLRAVLAGSAPASG